MLKDLENFLIGVISHFDMVSPRGLVSPQDIPTTCAFFEQDDIHVLVPLLSTCVLISTLYIFCLILQLTFILLCSNVLCVNDCGLNCPHEP